MLQKFLPILLCLIICQVLNAQDLIERSQNKVAIYDAIDIQNSNMLASRLEQHKQQYRKTKKVKNILQINTLRNNLPTHITSGVLLDLDIKALTKAREENNGLLEIQIPTGEDTYYVLDLYQVNIHTDDHYVVLSSTNEYITPSTGLFYHGIVQGNPNSTVALSLFEDELSCFIVDGRGNYKISKNTSDTDYILYNVINNEEEGGKLNCGVGTDDYHHLEPTSTYANGMRNCELLPEIGIYIEADHGLYNSKGSSTANVTQYVDDIMVQTGAIYSSIGLTIRLNGLKIFDTPDPYPMDVGDTKLEAFDMATAAINMNGLNHLLTVDDGGGIAYIDVICGTSNSGISGVETNPSVVPTYDDVVLLTHELGHNFGAPHTQACFWNNNNTAIDGCVDSEGTYDGTVPCPRPNMDCPAGGGTIMSYCDISDLPVTCTVQQAWHPQVAAHITSRVAVKTCLQAESCPPTRMITSAFVNGSYRASTSVETMGTVQVNGATHYSAPMVTLNSGFEVPTGQQFLTTTDGCLTANGTCAASFILEVDDVAYNGNTNNGRNIWETYGANTGYDGAEVIHAVKIEPFMRADVVLTNLSTNLDMFVTQSCDNTTVFASNIQAGTADETITLTNDAGVERTFYVIIDGAIGTSGSYDISFDSYGYCSKPMPFTCGTSLYWATPFGNISFDDYNGGTISATGPEIVHEFIQAANTTNTVMLSGLEENLELIILDNSCDNNIVVASSTNSGTMDESVTFTNNTGSPITRYIVVDAVDDNSDYSLDCM